MDQSSPRRRLDAAARRETILAAALPEFARAGFEQTRVADIAATVGVTEPVVFQNFGSKAGLFLAVLERAATQVSGHLAGLHGQAATVHRTLRELLSREHLDRLHSPGALGAIFVHAARITDPEVRKAAHDAHLRILRAIANLIREGQNEGSIRADVEAAALAGLVLSEVHARQFRKDHTRTSPGLEQEALEALLGVLAPH